MMVAPQARRSQTFTNASVRVDGLRDFRRELHRLAREGDPMGRELLKDANQRVGDLVVQGARRRASTPIERKAAATLRAGRQLARVIVTGGRARFPYFYGAEFGSYQNVVRERNGRTVRGWNQFKPWKRPGSGNTGYFLFPTMREESARIVEEYGRELEQVARRAFPN